MDNMIAGDGRRTGGERVASIASSLGSMSQVETSVREAIQDSNKMLCSATPLTPNGKRRQMIKMLTLTLMPIIVLTALAISDLIATLKKSVDASEIRRNVRFSRQVGTLVHSLQMERDMTALYISSLMQQSAATGPERKIFLINTYPLTDEVLESLNDWPVKGTMAYQQFQNKEALMAYLFEYRLTLDIHNTTIYEVIHFYTDAIQLFIDWLYESVGKSGGLGLWETLVAYQLLIVGMEQTGIERTLGAVFYTQGGFFRLTDYRWYMEKMQVGQSNIWASQKYSKLVRMILDDSIANSLHDDHFQNTITEMRSIISYNNATREPSWQEGQWWFDNMTIYIDILRDIQRQMAEVILTDLNAAVRTNNADLAVSISIMVLVVLFSVIIIKAVESLTYNMQNYVLTLADQTKALHKERKRTDTLLYQMLPVSVAENLKRNQIVHAENFSSATILFSDIVGFTRICSESSPLQVVEMLNNVYTNFDSRIDTYNVYKVETIGDAYMVVSGVPQRNGNKHASEIALMALDLLNCIKGLVIPHRPRTKMTLRIGIHTGAVVAGIVGSKMPRYCLFGETVNIASKMESNGLPNRIQISDNCHRVLNITGGYTMVRREEVLLTDKGPMTTYWLTGRTTEEPTRESTSSTPLQDQQESECDLTLNVPELTPPAENNGRIVEF
ncbi:uncharacterized protein [Diadema antillarum]|uniref:uncharacterized protein n=1 Tax=Diadema antillarum TaxID=105358 RepID=UPI003A852616